MGIFTIKRKLADLRRLRQILGIISEAGGGALLNEIDLSYLIPIKGRLANALGKNRSKDALVQQKPSGLKVSPVTLRKTLEKLGPTYVKLGQVLSLRTDLVGEAMAKEFSKLQNQVEPFSETEARKTIRDELGKDADLAFLAFDPVPIAAASLSQVHRAFLADGRKAAVKIQRPGIQETVEADIHILLHLAASIEKYIPESKPLKPVKLVQEFADWTLRELDFCVEGHNADRFRAMYADNPHVKIPKIIWSHTTPRVLTMEFIDGVAADDQAGMRRLGINPQTVARHGIRALLTQFVKEGFFHADPHPGNYFALPGNVICFQDFGMVGYLNRQQRQEMVSCFLAFTHKDAESLLKHVMHLVRTDAESDVSGFGKDVFEILNEFFYSPKTPSVAQSLFRILNKAPARGIGVPADLALFAKALVTTEAMGLKLWPDFDLNEELRPLTDEVVRDLLNPLKRLDEIKSDAFDYLDYLERLPEESMRMLDKIQRGELGVKIDASDITGLKEEFDRQNDVRILGAITVTVLIVTVFLRVSEGVRTFLGLPMSTLASGLSLILVIWLAIKVKKRPD
jgi:ubiquinone biosynthesis protein